MGKKIIKSEKRRQIDNIPIQIITYADWNVLLDGKATKKVKEKLKKCTQK